MDAQNNELKRRLAKKKKRYRLSSDNIINNDIGKTFKSIRINSIDINSNNESVDFISNKDLKLSDKDISNLNSYTTNSLTDKNSNNIDNSSNSIQIVLNLNCSKNTNLDELKNEGLKKVQQEISYSNDFIN